MQLQEKKPSRLDHGKASEMCQCESRDNTKQAHYSITEQELEDLLCEVRGNPNDRKSLNKSFEHRKKQADLLFRSFCRLSLEYGKALDSGMSPEEATEKTGIISHLGERAAHVDNCGNTLEFWKSLDGSGSPWKLHKAYFCHDRLCPMCVARRSLKILCQLSDIMNHIDTEKYSFLFLTLTVPNCSGDNLDATIQRLLKSFGDLCNLPEVKKVLNGYFRTLEVTFNHNFKSKSFMTFHPHLHVILAVPKSYFKKGYITQSKWLQMWRDSYGDQSITQVDIRKIKAKNIEEVKNDADLMEIAIQKAIKETAKYSVKATDYLFSSRNKMTDYAVKHLSRALHGVRLFAMKGIFFKVSKMLNQEDVMSDKADLIHVSHDDAVNPELAYMIVKFRWGGSCYDLLSVGLNTDVSECEVSA